MREVKLPSGNILKVWPAPFAAAKALFQALLRDLRQVHMSANMPGVFKELFCIGFSSPEIEQCLWECMKRCVYNAGSDLKIDADTFNDVDRWQDYTSVLVEVATENVAPFAKGLYAEYQRLLPMIPGSQT